MRCHKRTWSGRGHIGVLLDVHLLEPVGGLVLDLRAGRAGSREGLWRPPERAVSSRGARHQCERPALGHAPARRSASPGAPSLAAALEAGAGALGVSHGGWEALEHCAEERSSAAARRVRRVRLPWCSPAGCGGGKLCEWPSHQAGKRAAPGLLLSYGWPCLSSPPLGRRATLSRAPVQDISRGACCQIKCVRLPPSTRRRTPEGPGSRQSPWRALTSRQQCSKVLVAQEQRGPLTSSRSEAAARPRCRT